MIDKINIRALFIMLLPIIVISSCVDNQVNEVIQEYNNIEAQQKIVSEDFARYTATYFANEVSFNYNYMVKGKLLKRKGKQKEVESVLALKDSTKQPALFLVNYKEKGFVIISGDKTANPVLAYSDENSLPKNEEEISDGLGYWLSYNVADITDLREDENYDALEVEKVWKPVLNAYSPDQELYVIEPPDDGCTPSSTVVGPLLQTTWGQADGYNNYAPYLGCSYPYNGNALSGCVATAMAQVIRYHESPYNWYNWNSMPNGSGNNAVSELMVDAGNVVGMNWGCNSSYTTGTGDIAPALRNTFGYNSATQINYEGTNNYNDVRDDLDDGLPVIFSGCGKAYVFGIPYPKDCHAWVAEGYHRYTTCPGGMTTTHLFFYMNWGWQGNYNGYYAFNNFHPGSSDYDYKSKVIINIEP